ncbi:hypothetical protein QBC46DRAFT_417286 [Diplogelasinospora grovesii]|uniref:Uncharacterized protein n=1 Tax=Diplogelasinospora grovesii TaxID=303347 RepID=A0AAN6S1Y4_9PEZI|nr:hypothetical protein QBC46DRAFT_417286 [Diplogelasinospora grovesii]
MDAQSLSLMSDPNNDCLSLSGLSLSRISHRDEHEVKKLLGACMTDGGFYLGLDQRSDNAGSARHHHLLSVAEKVFSLTSEILDMLEEENLHWERDKWRDLQIGGYVHLSNIRAGNAIKIDLMLTPGGRTTWDGMRGIEMSLPGD